LASHLAESVDRNRDLLKALGQPNRRQRVIGWASVVLAALVASFFAALAGGELLRDPPQMTAFHLIEMPVLLGLAGAALRWPRAIGVLIAQGGPVGWAVPLFFFSTVENQSLPEKLAALAETWPFIAVTATTGILLFSGGSNTCPPGLRDGHRHAVGRVCNQRPTHDDSPASIV
jgi:hypothetical protein